MIRELAGDAHRLDEFLRARIGRPYHVLLGVGLVVEIIKELREFGEVGHRREGSWGRRWRCCCSWRC